MWSVTFPSAPAGGMKGAETPTMQQHLSGEMSVIRAQSQARLQAKLWRGTGDVLHSAAGHINTWDVAIALFLNEYKYLLLST